MSSPLKYLIAFLLSLGLGINLYARSDSPPYGHPHAELSDNYWGIITDIAHRWRDMDFSFWNRGVAGGVSLFSSGHYPVLNPTNALAWFLNDNQFYLVKLIEPYALGFFFMTILLWDGFKIRFLVALFGGLAYMGLTFSKFAAMAQSPFFLYGCALFPAMVLVFVKLSRRHITLAAGGVGALVAFQFLSEGVTQIPQMMIWWSLLLTVAVGSGSLFKPSFLRTGMASLLIFWGMAITIAGVQFIPTYHFFTQESARMAGYYPINNFSFFKAYPHYDNLATVISAGLFKAGAIRARVPAILGFTCLALAVVHFGRIFAKAQNRRAVYQIWIATIVFFLIPPTASQLAAWFPFLNSAFSFLTYFSFRYGLHILDFCLILTICLIINDEELAFSQDKASPIRKGVAVLFLCLALVLAVLPTILFLSPQADSWIQAFGFLSPLKPNTLWNGVKVLGRALILIALLTIRPRHRIADLGLAFVLIGVGFMMWIDCFKYNDKGLRTYVEEYQLTSPERAYYKEARGRYVHLYNPAEPAWMIHDYNLLYGVHGTAGFLPMPPFRFAKFLFYYEIRTARDFEKVPFEQGSPKFHMRRDAPSALTTYFPVDFTVVRKDTDLPWEGFVKVLSGEKYDVYERLNPAPRVYFANRLEIIDFFSMVQKFDEPRSATVYVTAEDAKGFGVKPEDLTGNPMEAKYSHFEQKKEDRLSFVVETPKEVFVVAPERYQKGWQIKIDGRRAALFPAYYLFLGFKIPPGDHFVELQFTPPGLWLGLFANVLGVIGLISLFRRHTQFSPHPALESGTTPAQFAQL